MAIRDESKPYILDMPAKIAAEYGGNKQAIRQAALTGQVSPTEAVLAGMFIDKMRSAAALENVPNQTIYEKTFAPPQAQAPAGLGATSQAQQMSQMAPPPAPTQMAEAPPAQPTAMLADGGLASLPVDESMFPDEYAGGGVVAFSAGGVPGYSDGEWINQGGLNVLGSEAGISSPMSMEDIISAAQQRRSIPLSDAEKAYLERLKSAPERAKQAKSDAFNQFLTSTGLRMLQSRAPGLLAAAGESATASTPLLFAGSKEAKEIEEAGLKGMAEMGRTERAEKLSGITAGERMYGEEAGRLSREDIARLDREGRLDVAKIQRDSMEKIARDRQTDFQRKWALYTEDAKSRGVKPSIKEFQKIFPESQAGNYLSAVMKANPLGDPTEWFSKAEQMARLDSFTDDDRQAAAWALNPENKNDPRAKEIRQRLGI